MQGMKSVIKKCAQIIKKKTGKTLGARQTAGKGSRRVSFCL